MISIIYSLQKWRKYMKLLLSCLKMCDSKIELAERRLQDHYLSCRISVVLCSKCMVWRVTVWEWSLQCTKSNLFGYHSDFIQFYKWILVFTVKIKFYFKEIRFYSYRRSDDILLEFLMWFKRHSEAFKVVKTTL